jgi:signal transduction histidine kinase
MIKSSGGNKMLGNRNLPKGLKNDDLLNRLAHDLMNPLTVVLGYSQLLASRDDLPEEAKLQAQELYQQAMESVSIVEKIKKVVASRHRLAGGTVLVVDPEDQISPALQGILGSRVTVEHVSSLPKAEEIINTKQVDVVVLNQDKIPVEQASQVLEKTNQGSYDNFILVTTDPETQENLSSMGFNTLEFPFSDTKVFEYMAGE